MSRALGWWLVLLAASPAVAACALLQPAPARQISLPGTSWTVGEIDGRPPGGGPYTIAFSSAPETATIDGPCGSIVKGFTYDTDGDALGFGDSSSTQSRPCTNEEGVIQTELLSELGAVTGWRVASGSSIFLRAHGVDVMQLRRADTP